MLQIIVAVRDQKLDAYLRPFTAATRGQAIRAFGDEVNRQGSELSQHPEDYALWHLGTFDDASGIIRAAERPEQIALADDLVEQPFTRG